MTGVLQVFCTSGYFIPGVRNTQSKSGLINEQDTQDQQEQKPAGPTGTSSLGTDSPVVQLLRVHDVREIC